MSDAQTAAIRIFDTTLRDGEQSPGCSMNLQEKLALARQLEKLGADVIEAVEAAVAGIGLRVDGQEGVAELRALAGVDLLRRHLDALFGQEHAHPTRIRRAPRAVRSSPPTSPRGMGTQSVLRRWGGCVRT